MLDEKILNVLNDINGDLGFMMFLFSVILLVLIFKD